MSIGKKRHKHAYKVYEQSLKRKAEQEQALQEAEPLEELELPGEAAEAEEATESETEAVEETAAEEEKKKVYYESELIDEEAEEDSGVKLVNFDEEGVKYFYESEVIEDDTDEVVSLEFAEPHEPEEVIYEVDPITDDEDANVKIPKFINLPNLVDYMLTMDLSKAAKANLELMLIKAYGKYKYDKEERTLILRCMFSILKTMVATK